MMIGDEGTYLFAQWHSGAKRRGKRDNFGYSSTKCQILLQDDASQNSLHFRDTRALNYYQNKNKKHKFL